MTREEALDTMGATLDDWIDKENMHMLIDKIYDNFEEAKKPKTCDTFDKGASSTNYPPKTIFAFGNYYTLKDKQ